MISSYMTKLEFLQDPNMLFRLGKLLHFYAACIVLSFLKPGWPLWEIYHALKIKIMYTPPTYALLLHRG